MRDEITMVMAGEAGQGIKTVEMLMAGMLEDQKLFFFISREYMSRVRGGINSTQITVSRSPVNCFRNRTDLFISLTDEAGERYRGRFDENTVFVGSDDFVDIAKENGDLRYANSAVFGYMCAYIGAGSETGAKLIEKTYRSKADTIPGNLASFKEGYRLAARKGKPYGRYRGKRLVFDNAKAAAYGAVFGGCSFISSYPMSPATSVFTNLAGLSGEYGILVEQAEDEIAAINMALGASYAGARPLVATSGGGFALMEEGISLAGATETPVVVLLGQRPGPATGLPTRTEQGDFDLVLYSGHGDFQRVIYAPGDQVQTIKTMIRAFDTAFRYQIPVFVLTDQYMLDSLKPVKAADIPKPYIRDHIVRSDSDYARYRFTPDGISPRGVPGYGDGSVCADSDEHDEEGRITEDPVMRARMVEKRNKRLDKLKQKAESPLLIGPEKYRDLFVCYGSNLGAAMDLEDECEESGCAFLHFNQLHPLGDDVKVYLDKAEKLHIIENNYSGRYADYLEKRFSVRFADRILKYNGEPFSIEEISKKMKEA